MSDFRNHEVARAVLALDAELIAPAKLALSTALTLQARALGRS
jgi:hypothetical protein